MHGYEPGTVTPSTELLLQHKHPEDRAQVAEVLERVVEGEPFQQPGTASSTPAGKSTG